MCVGLRCYKGIEANIQKKHHNYHVRRYNYHRRTLYYDLNKQHILELSVKKNEISFKHTFI